MGISLAASTEEAGDIKYIAKNSVPNGWLECNGAAISRSAYAGLFAAIGVSFGGGNGVDNFNIPYFRCEIIRGFDNGRGVDSGRVFGSEQDESLKSHTHTATLFRVNGSGDLSSKFGAYTDNSSRGTGTTDSTGGNETRPRNIAFLPCIKY
jgi:microcystin-dependent protein